VYVGEAFAIVPLGDINVGAAGEVGPAIAFTVIASPELHVLCPDAFHARTHQLYVSFASALEGVNVHVPPDPHPKDDAASVVSIVIAPMLFCSRTWYCVAVAEESQVKPGVPVETPPLGAICVGVAGTGAPRLTVKAVGPLTPLPAALFAVTVQV